MTILEYANYLFDKAIIPDYPFYLIGISIGMVLIGTLFIYRLVIARFLIRKYMKDDEKKKKWLERLKDITYDSSQENESLKKRWETDKKRGIRSLWNQYSVKFARTRKGKVAWLSTFVLLASLTTYGLQLNQYEEIVAKRIIRHLETEEDEVRGLLDKWEKEGQTNEQAFEMLGVVLLSVGKKHDVYLIKNKEFAKEYNRVVHQYLEKQEKEK